jgi:hypothetical protein
MPVQRSEWSDDPFFDPGADIVAIGDSWFHFPKNNLLEAIDRALGRRVTIQAYGDNGLRIVDYLEPTLRGFWTRAIASMPLRVKALLLSGGGNDFAGEDDFRTLIRDDCSAAGGLDACWRDGEPAALFDRVASAYRDIIRDARQAGFRGTVFVHAYDYAIPTGVGFNRFIGGWLKKPMDTSHVPPALHRDLVRALVDELEKRLRGLEDPAGPVVFVDSTGVLRADEWHDELHPTRAGFDRLARECWVPAVEPVLGLPTFAMAAAPRKRAKAPSKRKVPVKRVADSRVGRTAPGSARAAKARAKSGRPAARKAATKPRLKAKGPAPARKVRSRAAATRSRAAAARGGTRRR